MEKGSYFLGFITCITDLHTICRLHAFWNFQRLYSSICWHFFFSGPSRCSWWAVELLALLAPSSIPFVSKICVIWMFCVIGIEELIWSKELMREAHLVTYNQYRPWVFNWKNIRWIWWTHGIEVKVYQPYRNNCLPSRAQRVHGIFYVTQYIHYTSFENIPVLMDCSDFIPLFEPVAKLFSCINCCYYC